MSSNMEDKKRIETTSRKLHWTRLKENEMLMVKPGDRKFCEGCVQFLPANLTYFGRSCVKKSEQYRLVYLRPRCRKCFTPTSTASIERRREISLKHYHDNKKKHMKQRARYNIRKKLDKHITFVLLKNKWKNAFKNVLNDIIKK